MGARSYELQVWWEIQPRVEEVYPQRNRAVGVLVKPREEDERKTRVVGRMSAEKEAINHIFREEQSNVDLQESLKRRGSAGGLTL